MAGQTQASGELAVTKPTDVGAFQSTNLGKAVS